MLMENMEQSDEKENEVVVPRPDVPAPEDEHGLSQNNETGSGERAEQSFEENSARLEMADKVEHAQSPYSFKESTGEAKSVAGNASSSPVSMVSIFLFTALLMFGLLGWFVAGELSKKMDQLSGTVSELSMVIAAGQAESRKGEVFVVTAELKKTMAILEKVEKLGDEKATAKAKKLLVEARQIVAKYEGIKNSAGK
jgi:hypothetical protein